MNVRGNIPTKFSLGIFRGHFRQTNDPGISSEVCFLGIPSENSEGFPRKEEIPRNYFRRLVLSKLLNSLKHDVSSNALLEAVYLHLQNGQPSYPEHHRHTS
ncbi:hypothetical protein YC2023_053003 [Brassica napus]